MVMSNLLEDISNAVTKRANKIQAEFNAASGPQCAEGQHWDDFLQVCVPDATPPRVSIPSDVDPFEAGITAGTAAALGDGGGAVQPPQWTGDAFASVPGAFDDIPPDPVQRPFINPVTGSPIDPTAGLAPGYLLKAQQRTQAPTAGATAALQPVTSQEQAQQRASAALGELGGFGNTLDAAGNVLGPVADKFLEAPYTAAPAVGMTRPGTMGPTKTVENQQALQGVGQTAYDAYMADVPVVSPILREEVAPRVGAATGAIADSPINPAAPLLNAASEAVGTPSAQQIGQTAGEALTPVSAGDIALSVFIPATADWADAWRLAKSAGIIDDTGRLLTNSRPAVEAVLQKAGKTWDELTRAAVTPEAGVLRLGVGEGAVAPIQEASMAGSRGGMNVVDPSGVRILGPDEPLQAGEREMFHGTAGALRGDTLEPGTFVTPLRQDAESYARTAAAMGRQEAGPLRRLVGSEQGMARVPLGPEDAGRGADEAVGTLYHGMREPFDGPLELRSGRNSTIFGDEGVNRPAVFLSESRDAAADFGGTPHVGAFKLKPGTKVLDLTDGGFPLDVENALIEQGWSPQALYGANPIWEMFDSPEFVASLRELGYGAARYGEESPQGIKGVTTAIFDPSNVTRLDEAAQGAAAPRGRTAGEAASSSPQAPAAAGAPSAGGGAPPIERPPTTGGGGPGDVPPPAGDPVSRLTELVDQARPLPELTEAERKAERARRVAIMASEQERGGFTDEAFRRGQSALGGEYPRANFEPVGESFSPEEVQQLRNMIGESDLRPLERNNVNNALNTVLEGRLNEVRPFEIALLDRVYGPEFSFAVASKAVPPTLTDKVHEFWVASILSGPDTFLRNVGGNTVSAGMAVPERAFGAALEPFARRITGRDTERWFQEVPAQIHGMIEGVPEGVRAALETIKTGRGTAALTESVRPEAIKGLKGRIVRIPFTGLEMMDSFFGAINYAGAHRALAVRTARNEGLTGRALQLRIADLIANPTDEIIETASKERLLRLFRDDPTRYGQWIMDGRQKVPGLRFLVPFARTPDRLIAFGAKRSPLGLLDFPMWQRLVKGNPEAVDELAATMMGSTIALGLGALVAGGHLDITGAIPSTQGARDRFYREGKLPFSVNIPGVGWTQFSQIPGLDTALTSLVAAKEAVEKGESPDRAIAGLGADIASNIFDRSYVSGLADFVEIFSSGGYEDPVDSAQRWAGRQVSGAVPFSAALRQGSGYFDRTVYKPEGIVEELATGIGMGGVAGVPPRLTAFGEEAERAPIKAPVAINKDQQTAIDAELERLGVEVGFVGKTIGGRKLTRDEQQEYQRLAGQETLNNLSLMIGTPLYEGLSDPLKEKALQRAIDKARDMVRDKFNLRFLQESAQPVGSP